MAVTPTMYGVLGAGAGIAFTYFVKGIPGVVIAAIVGFIVGFAAGSLPAFPLMVASGTGLPGVVVVPGIAGATGFTVANFIL